MNNYIYTFLIIANFISAEPPLDEIKIIKQKSGDIIVYLEKERGVSVKLDSDESVHVALVNVDGVLESIQINKDGETPISIAYLSETKAKISISRPEAPDNGGLPIYIDNDGDGIPDVKLDVTGYYKLKDIIWEKVEKKNKGGIKEKMGVEN